MRKRFFRQTLYLTFLIGAIAGNMAAGASQDQKISPYLLLSYLKNTDSQKVLIVKMTNITQTGEVPLPGLSIRFYNGEAMLGEAVTDITGNAAHTIESRMVLTLNADGTMPFSAEFEGDSLIDAAYGELSITDVDLAMTLGEEEGRKIVTLTATLPSPDGPVPAAGEEIGVYVPRMFSLLPVAVGVLDDEGRLTIEFPDNVPGDSLGNLTVIGRFNEHYLYGSVERREHTHWGVAAEKVPPVHRSLWSTLAPKWMVVTLAIMLMGVWGHYFFVIFSLVRIKMNGRKHQADMKR